jgi:hypothetical protein
MERAIACDTGGMIAAGNFHDPQNARIVYLAVAGLLLLAVCVSVATVLWWRHAKVEHPALGPLEVMSSRRWWQSDYNARITQLDKARPLDDNGEAVPAHEPLDLEIAMNDEPHDFADLIDEPFAEPSPE